jgi:large subunit ribosomal protein L25
MSKTPQLTALPLTATSKGEIKRLRQSGFIPVSIQHRRHETLHLQEDEKLLNAFIVQHGNSGVAEMVVGADKVKHTVVVHDIQRDPISKRLLHVTFQDMEKGDTVKTHVSLVFRGEPEAVRLGDGVLSQALSQLEIRSDVLHLVDHIVVDVSHMELGGSLRVSDLPKQDGYEILTPEDTLIASVSEPTAAEAEVVTEPTAVEAPAA